MRRLVALHAGGGDELVQQRGDVAKHNRARATEGQRWTWRQSDRAKSTPKTANALLTAEGVNDIEAKAVEAAMEELVSLVREHCGGEGS